GLIVLERDRTQRVAIAFFNWHGDIDRFALLANQRNADAAAGVVNLRLGILDQHLEIAAILVLRAHPFGVLVQFTSVVGLGKNVLKKNGMRNANKLQVLHGSAQNSLADVLVPDKGNLAHLHFGAFFYSKDDSDGSGRDGPHLAADNRKLPSMLGQQFLDHDFHLLHLGRIVLTLHRKPDLALLETIKHIAGRYRTQSRVVDLPDRRTLLDHHVQLASFGCLFTFEADVFEVSRVPK